MNKKLISQFLLMGLLIGNVTYAQVVTVDGIGIDKDSAVRDAMRNAVEQVVGVHINSLTLVNNAAIEMDHIYTNAQGYVKNYKILSEDKTGNQYKVKMSLDVNDTPNSALMNKLNMISMLNDPRIAVVINCNQGNPNERKRFESICSAKVNSELLDIGFSHVVDRNLVTGPNNEIIRDKKYSDYMVLGTLDVRTNAIQIPNFYSYGNNPANNPHAGGTGLNKAVANMATKIIKTDTQELITEFTLSETKMADTPLNAIEGVLDLLGQKTSDRVAVAFSKKAAKVVEGKAIIVRADSYDVLLQIQNELGLIHGVDKVFIRSYEAGKGNLEITSSQGLSTVYRMLKEKTKLNLFMENSSENRIEISASK